MKAVRPLLAGLLLVCFKSSAFGSPPAFESRECLPAVAGVRCGVIQVPEDHSRPRGRMIELEVLVLPATGALLHPQAPN